MRLQLCPVWAGLFSPTPPFVRQAINLEHAPPDPTRGCAPLRTDRWGWATPKRNPNDSRDLVPKKPRFPKAPAHPSFYLPAGPGKVGASATADQLREHQP